MRAEASRGVDDTYACGKLMHRLSSIPTLVEPWGSLDWLGIVSASRSLLDDMIERCVRHGSPGAAGLAHSAAL
jgi:hypothetical protein